MATFFRRDGWVKSALGSAVPGAQIYVCAPQPANTDSLPPSPLATIFSDPNGLVEITQPIITDGFGHYDYYTLPGLYTEIVGLSGVVQQVYPDQTIGGVGTSNPPGNDTGLVAGTGIQIVGNVISATATSVLLQTEGVDNALQNKLNLTSSDDSVTLVANGAGAVDLSVPPVTPSTAYSLLGNLRGWLANWDAADVVGVGVTMSGGVGSKTRVDPTATEGAAVSYTSAGSPTAQAAMYTNNVLGISRGAIKWWQARCKIGSTGGSILYYAGLTDVNPGTTAMQTVPTTQNVCAFRYLAGDPVWTICVCDGLGTSIIANTSVPVDTNFHLFRMLFSAGQVLFYIDGVLVGTLTTNLPAVGTQLGSMLALQGNAIANTMQYLWYSF